MEVWKQLKTLFGGKTPDPEDEPHREEAETTPEMKTGPISHAHAAGRQTKPVTTPLVPLTLYFSGWGYDERKGGGQKRGYGKNTELTEVSGQTFEMRTIYDCFLFRAYGDTDERACLFLKYISKQIPYHRDFKKQEFAQAYAQLEYGRCLLYIADFMTPRQCAYMYFDPDGSGFAQDENWTQMASFQWREAFGQSWPQFLAADPEQLRPLCKHLFDAQINPRCANPYTAPEPADDSNIPHRFLKGSEEELRRLTIAIVQTEPEFFKDHFYPMTIKYRAQTPTKRAGMTRVTQGQCPLRSRSIPGRVTSLCDLVLRVNTFTGVEWKTRIPASIRQSDWEKHIHKICVTVHPPSAHERAESLLVLADWLQGKVREEKRLRLLGVEEGREEKS